VTPFLLVLSAPSGAGKTRIKDMLLQGRDDVAYSVSATTRAPRSGEVDGRSYHFLAREEFERRRDAGEFAEWAPYAGNLYGTLKSELERIVAQGKHPVLDIEVEGARQLRAHYPSSVLVFVLPPSGRTLVERLVGRNTEPPEVVARRLRHAAEELGAVGEYDYAVVNDDLTTAVAQVASILDAETRRVARQAGLPDGLEQLQREIDAAARRLEHQAREPRTEAVRER
jgi:guanylate kinase